MPPPRPRGVGYTTGVSSVRPSPQTPMSERQQMALLIQMTATSNSEAPRTHLKKTEHGNKKSEDIEDSANEKQEGPDSSTREKTATDENTSENRKESASDGDMPTSSNVSKRNFSDVEEDEYEDSDDVTKKKKRKDSDSGKETKPLLGLRLNKTFAKGSASSKTATSTTSITLSTTTDKDATDNAKSTSSKTVENETEDDDSKVSDNMYSGGPKVPPLKIVIPQQNCSIDTDGNVSRTGKINTSRSAGLPYVVSSSNESNDREINSQCNSPHESPLKISSACTTIDEKNMKLTAEEKNLHRVLRSSHRSGGTSLERSSNNSSPQMQSSSPSPASSNTNEAAEGKINFNSITASPMQPTQNYENETILNLPSPSTSSTSSSKEINPPAVELHPRKRKIRSKNEDNSVKANNPTSSSSASAESSTTVNDTHPHDFPFTNCFQMYLNIRRQIEKKWKNMCPVKPNPPQGYADYLINKRSYLLSTNKDKPNTVVPSSVPVKMNDIFLIQEKERHELSQRHTVEREKLCLNVEQEILRVHAKAARNVNCQSVPYSACTLLKDEEVYNVITPEQEEKDRNAPNNARHRFNLRLLLSWLQDVDDKWEKIKESMVLRHHNEAESLHAVQLMDWEIALKKYQLCDFKSQLVIENDHVPIVYVSDDFDLLPA